MCSDRFEITHEPHDDTERAFKVIARGEIDVDSVGVLGAQFDEVTERGAMLIVLDASDVEFVDSSGLRCIIAAAKNLKERGGTFLIEGMSPAVQRVFEVTGLLEEFRSGE